MIVITDKVTCCGCWACENICPKHCVVMKEDNEGFRYPEVDVEVCIECGRVSSSTFPKNVVSNALLLLI